MADWRRGQELRGAEFRKGRRFRGRQTAATPYRPIGATARWVEVSRDEPIVLAGSLTVSIRRRRSSGLLRRASGRVDPARGAHRPGVRGRRGGRALALRLARRIECRVYDSKPRPPAMFRRGDSRAGPLTRGDALLSLLRPIAAESSSPSAAEESAPTLGILTAPPETALVGHDRPPHRGVRRSRPTTGSRAETARRLRLVERCRAADSSAHRPTWPTLQARR